MTHAKRLIIEALEDSYYPDLGLKIAADNMLKVLETDPLYSSCEPMLEALNKAFQFISTKQELTPNDIQFLKYLESVIDKATALG